MDKAKDVEMARGRRLATLANFSRPMMEKCILDAISANLSLSGDGLAVIGQKKDAQLVKWIIENEYVPIEKIRQAVHAGICDIGREMFEWCGRESAYRKYPDHCLSPEALGYAMKHGSISNQEIASIRFDHGETAEQYIASSDGLFEKVMRQLRSGTAFFDLSNLVFPADSCCCHD